MLAALTALTIPHGASVQGTPQSQPYVTRAEVAAILLYSRNSNLPSVQDEGRYRDVAFGNWYQGAMLAAAKLGIVEADASTQELRPNEYLNRAEFLKMLNRTFALEEGAAQTFRDVDAGAWYAPYTKVAQTYDLFPDDPNIIELQPEKIMTYKDAISAASVIVRVRSGVIPQNKLVTRVQPIGNKVVYLTFDPDNGTVFFISQPQVMDEEPVPQTLAQQKTELLELVNVERTRFGLHPLTYNKLLEQSAQRYAELMAREKFFSHVSPEGQTLKQRMEATGYYNRNFSASCNCVKGYAIAENLAVGQKSPREAYQDWMESTEHRSALLGPDYTQTGFGIDLNSFLWVEHFGGILLPSGR